MLTEQELREEAIDRMTVVTVERILALSTFDVAVIDSDTVKYEVRLATYNVLAYTNRGLLNEPLEVVVCELSALNWLKQQFIADDPDSLRDALTVGDVLSISEGDTRIAYQNQAQLDGVGVHYGAFAYKMEQLASIVKRYRRVHWGSAMDVDYG